MNVRLFPLYGILRFKNCEKKKVQAFCLHDNKFISAYIHTSGRWQCVNRMATVTIEFLLSDVNFEWKHYLTYTHTHTQAYETLVSINQTASAAPNKCVNAKLFVKCPKILQASRQIMPTNDLTVAKRGKALPLSRYGCRRRERETAIIRSICYAFS